MFDPVTLFYNFNGYSFVIIHFNNVWLLRIAVSLYAAETLCLSMPVIKNG